MGMVRGGVPQQIDLKKDEEREQVLDALCAIQSTPDEDWDLMALLRRYPRPHGTFAKSQLLGAYRRLVEEGAFQPSAKVERRLRGRPVRTISGVAPVAVLTEPYACPGTCIFCPEQEGAPKSYLDGEPGVLRAIQNAYDPYDQTRARIEALEAIGHATDKIELLVLGGTWSAYPEAYQDHFLLRCFDAMNETPSETLSEALQRNETAPHRNVGLVIETRPDEITPAEVLRLRRQGVTKVQLGVQSLDDEILRLNRRGHTVADTERAIRLLRLAGFKLVVHWMPNLHGATPATDLADFGRIFENPAIRPDEMKIYPTALLRGTELYNLWEAGEYAPYDEETLIELLAGCKQQVQPYCRINRVMRDIPANYIVAGTTKSNLRQIVQQRMHQQGLSCNCIRCREVRGKERVDLEQAELAVVSYQTDATEEHLLQYLTPSGRLAGFLRLSFPTKPRTDLPIPEIRDAAMVRELHVYGPAQYLGERRRGVQHRGLGTQLLDEAARRAEEAGFRELAVIAAVGTRVYYRERGFIEGELYPIRPLSGPHRGL
ncbi:MAG: elongator complex protein 3 [Anaerolineae bacterium]